MLMMASTFRASDHTELTVYTWDSHRDGSANKVIHILHGMSEHSRRYNAFAQALAKVGYTVYAHDHRGHGRTAKSDEEKGFFAEKAGWVRTVNDALELASDLKDRHPNAKLIGFGHSMGSFLLRSILQRDGSVYDGVILSGTGANPGPSALFGMALARLEMQIRGKRAKSKLMNQLMFGAFSRCFTPRQTPFDWLSRDQAEVRKYIDDPDCGNVFTTSFYADLITGVRSIYKRQEAECAPKGMPVLLLSGDSDPVGGFGRGVRQVYERFRSQGFEDVTLRLYPGGRHEMLNETNKEEVVQDILAWLDQRFL